MATPRLLAQLAERLGNPLEWSAVAKGILLCWIVVPFYLLYLAYALAIPSLSGNDTIINTDWLRVLIIFLLGLTATGLTLGALGLWYWRRRPDSRGYQHVAVQFFATSMTLLGYQVGSLSLASGIVLAGAPIVGFILFDRWAVLGGFATALVILFGSALLSAYGHIPYAPVLVPEAGGGEASPFWVTGMLVVFSLPHLIGLFALSAYVIHRWHERESEIKELAIMDPLTELPNRRWILAELDREVERSRRTGQPLAVIMLDLDHFKTINDDYGHQAGDRVLRAVGTALREAIRTPDQAGRYGGEEFLILLPDTQAEQALEVAERCRQRLTETPVVIDNGPPVRTGASLGVAGSDGNARPEWLIKQADQALYEAKTRGRNQVRLASDSG